MSYKTPVSKLQELMAKKGFSPVYEIKNISGVCHNPTFEYVVHANSITATGCGKTKQEAKHNAALNALKQFAELGLYSMNNDNKCKTYIDSNIISSPVSLLQEKMIKKGFSPVYVFSQNIASSHNPTFEYVVRVSDITAYGKGGTKREAKNNAAKNALIQLQIKDNLTFSKNCQTNENLSTLTKTERTIGAVHNSTFTPVSELQNLIDGTRLTLVSRVVNTLINIIEAQHNPTFKY